MPLRPWRTGGCPQPWRAKVSWANDLMLITGTSYLCRRAGPSGVIGLARVLLQSGEKEGPAWPPLWSVRIHSPFAKGSARVERLVFAQPEPGSDPELSRCLLSADSRHPARPPGFHGGSR